MTVGEAQDDRGEAQDDRWGPDAEPGFLRSGQRGSNIHLALTRRSVSTRRPIEWLAGEVRMAESGSERSGVEPDAVAPLRDAGLRAQGGQDARAPREAWGVPEAQLVALYLRVLGGDLGAAQIWFDQGVLDRYRGRAGFRVIRTDTAGRVQAERVWSLDFGIAGDDRLIHASAADVAQRLPPPERQHWAGHLATPPASRNFTIMRLGAGACIDDGNVRDWPGSSSAEEQNGG